MKKKRQRNFYKFGCLALSLLLLSGCVMQRKIQSNQLLHLRLGMTKEQVINKLGEPSINRGSFFDRSGREIELLEYIIIKPLTDEQVGAAALLIICTLGLIAPLMLGLEGPKETYWLYFAENRLMQWGKAGDWQKEADNIQEIRFR